MDRFKFIPMLPIVVGLFLTAVSHAQNPPMNCTQDGIIEVCSLADTTASQNPVEAVALRAPHVTYKNGQLTVVAENVPLRDVLHEISDKTGASLDVPPGSAMEPVFVNIGPGSVRDVLVALLNGTEFNYVMLGSQNTADRLQKIVLTPAGQSTEVAQSEAPSSPLPSAFSSPGTRPVMTAPDTAPKSAEQGRADLVAQFEARKQEMKQRYMEMMAKAAARASDQSTSSDSQTPSSDSDSQAQASGSSPQSQSSGSGSPTQPPPSGSQAQASGSDSQAQQQ